MQYSTGADPGQFDGLVVLNSNSGSGSYTLYRDSASPTGTIKLDGGAKSTTSPHLTLALHATNPTAGDPVSDMAFSINGGAFGAWQPYATTANLTVPTGDGAKTVTVEYRNGAGAVSTATATIYLIQHPPTVTSLSPTSGPTAGGNIVTVKGTKFAPGATVKFGSAASPKVTFVSATQLTAKAPGNPVGKVNVTVSTPAGSSPASSADLYAYGVPAVTSVAPEAGPTAGGTTVTIRGSNFTSAMTVRFGSVASSSVTFVSATQVKAKAPAHSAAAVDIVVHNAAGTSPAGSGDVYIYGVPKVTSVSPNSGPIGGGNPVTITGTGFVHGATVKFGATASAAVTFVSATQLKAKAPAHGAGAVGVSVHTPAGTSAAAANAVYAYGAPTITSLTPNAGPAAGGNTVTINGTGFAPGATVRFDTATSTTVTFVSGTQLKAKAPAHAAATIHVTVHTAAGAQGNATTNAYAYGPPKVTSVSPSAGPTAGGNTVTITGGSFVPGATVIFGSTPSASVTFASSTQLKAKAPAHAAATVDVKVHTPAGASATSAGDHYTY